MDNLNSKSLTGTNRSERRAGKLKNRYLANGDKADGFENKYGYNWDYVLVLPVPLTVQRENMIYREKMKVDAISLYKLEEEEMNHAHMPDKEEREIEGGGEGDGEIGTHLDGDLDRQEQGTAGISSAIKGTIAGTGTSTGMGTGTGTGRGLSVKDNLQEKERQDKDFKDKDGMNLAPSSQTDGLSANEVSIHEYDLYSKCNENPANPRMPA